MINLLLGIWQFLLVWAVGWALLRRFNLGLSTGLRLALAFALGEVILSYAYFAMGLIGGLRFWVLVPLAVVATFLFFPNFFCESFAFFRSAFQQLKAFPLASGITLILLIIYALAACVPEREVDSLWYHLAVPLHYIQNGGAIQLVPFNMPSHYPMNVHLHYTFSLLVGNDTTAKAFIVCHFLPLLILLAAVIKRYTGLRWALLAVGVYMCCLHFRLPVMVNVQRAVYFHVFLSTALLWRALESRDRRLFWLAALFCGMAMGTKFNGVLFGYVGQWLLLLIWFFILHQEPLITGVKLWGGHSLIAWLMMSPWLIKSWWFTGNPLYPMLGNLIPTQEAFVPAMRSNANNHGLNLLKSDSLAEFFAQVQKNVEWLLYNADLIFFLGLLAALVLGLYRKREWQLPILSAWIAYGLFPLLWGSDIARLFAVNYGTITLLIAMLFAVLERHTQWSLWLARLVLIGLFITFLQQRYFYLRSPSIAWFGQPALSYSARVDWLDARELYDRELFAMKEWMDAHVTKQEKLYGYRTGYLFYLNRPYIVSGAHFGEQFTLWAEQGHHTIAQRLKELGIEWVLMNEKGLDAAPDKERHAWNAFKREYLNLAHREGDYVLYRLIDI